MTEKGKEDGSVAETVEEKVQELITDAKEETGGSTSAAGVLGTLKGGFRTVTGGVGTVWQTLGEWNDQGTPLRKMFKTVRLDLEDTAARARERAACRQTKMRENLQKMAEEKQARFKEFDKSGIKKQHPELVVGGFTLAVALPSALAGRRAFFRNGARALVLSSAVVYGEHG